MLGNLVNYDSSDDDEDQNNTNTTQKNEQKVDNKIELEIPIKKPPSPKPQKRRLNYQNLVDLKPFKQVKDDEEDNLNNLSPTIGDKQNQEDRSITVKGLNNGVKVFKLSKPKSELRNVGDEEMQKNKKKMTNQEYQEHKQGQKANRKIMGSFSKKNVDREKRLKGKLDEILNSETGTAEQMKIDQFDTNDNMFITDSMQARVDNPNYAKNNNPYNNIEDDEDYQEEKKVFEQQAVQTLGNRHQNKREQKFIENLVELEQNDLFDQNWKDMQEKQATKKELLKQQNIQVPKNYSKARSKNQINFLARDIISQDHLNLGASEGRKKR